MSDLKRTAAYRRKAEEALQAAHILLSASSPSGTVNRAHYALFDCILALLHTTDSPVSKTHTGAHIDFCRQFIKTGLFAETCSATISGAFNLRQGGDYEVDFTISVEDGQVAVNQATDFPTAVRTYLNQHGFNLSQL